MFPYHYHMYNGNISDYATKSLFVALLNILHIVRQLYLTSMFWTAILPCLNKLVENSMLKLPQ